VGIYSTETGARGRCHLTAWKLPPRAKVFEALTAVADGRVRLVADGRALVGSSGGDKEYTVEWSRATGRPLAIAANDNASYWQGYLGYPIVAVLMALGEVAYDPAVAAVLARIPWNDVNRRHRHAYEAAVAEVLDELGARGADVSAVDAEVGRIMAQLAALDLEKGPRRARPPKGD
jgi:hypothetical protein